VTGFVQRDLYQDYLMAADLAVQLRTESRGETSAAVLDCLAYGLATLVNAHGWAAELPQGTVASVPDEATTAVLASALERLWGDPEKRSAMARQGRDYVKAEHNPARVAALYQEAIEDIAAGSPGSIERRLLGSLARIEVAGAPERCDLVDTALCIAENRPALGPRQLLVDISALADFDLKTGIQRVSRAVLKRLLENPPDGYRVEPVRQAGGQFIYARRATLGLLKAPEVPLVDDPIEAAPGDVFLGLDLAYDSMRFGKGQLEHLRSRGVKVIFVVYDLLPVLRAECFPDPIPAASLDWMRGVAEHADGAVCISRTVADELARWLDQERPLRQSPFHLGYFHLGADLAASLPSGGLEPGAERVLGLVRSRPTFLMVGTVEPRKGHAQTLAAFEVLWRQGIDVGLAIVGSRGWNTDELMLRLRTHSEREERLVWLERASDEMLDLLYDASCALLAASEGEGFGLPLVEAAQHRLPVVARDIPVFREVAGEHAFYFSGGAAEDLARGIREWLALDAVGAAPASSDMPWLTWAESTERLLASVLGDGWYTHWPRPD
jgi:glycosyltransferase involved in cell wall biosynthesis